MSPVLGSSAQRTFTLEDPGNLSTDGPLPLPQSSDSGFMGCRSDPRDRGSPITPSKKFLKDTFILTKVLSLEDLDLSQRS